VSATDRGLDLVTTPSGMTGSSVSTMRDVMMTVMACLGLSIDRDPWALSFGVLDQAAAAGFLCEPRSAVGAARVEVADPPAAEWCSVTRVREERATARGFSAVLDTDHPGGLTARVEIREGGDGTIAVTLDVDGAAVIGQSFVARDGERFLGFGERSHAVSLEHGVVENYVGEGPYQPHEYPFLTDTVPAWGIRNRPDAAYFPLPWVLSTRGYGLSIDQDDLSYVRLRVDSPDRWSIEVEAARLSYTVYAGPAPLDALRRYTAATGRQPAPARWFFGPWYQSGHANHVPLEEERRQLEALRGAAASAVETHCRYLPLGEDRGHDEEERARTAFFHSRGLAVLSYINPLVGAEYREAFEPAERAGALQRDRSGRTYLFRAYAGGRVPPYTEETQYDFTSPAAASRWAEVAERILAAGHDGWMEDFGEYTPLDAVASDGTTGVAGHNRYPTDYHRAAAEVAAELERRHGRRLARFVRSGWTGSAAVVPIVWGGDPTTSWGFDGLASAVIEGLSMGASGVAMWGSDTGGFMSTLDRLTPELLRRWIQLSAFCPVMRTKAGGIEIPPYERPQIWDQDVLPSWRRWSRWHTRLNDYLMAAHDAYRATGRPIMCALELVHPSIGPVSDQYLLGEHLLVAPVLEPGGAVRRVVLPEGRWVDLFDPRRSYSGPAEIDVEVGPHDIPVLLRAGAVLGLLPEDVDSLSPYAPALADRRCVLAVAGEPGRTWSGSIGPDLSCRTETGEGWWTLELSAPRPFAWDVTMWPPHPPAEVDADGPWSFDAGALSCSLAGTPAVIRVRWA
jgi:alpha-glucosidase (family GH31 glycosyl hydrolase)